MLIFGLPFSDVWKKIRPTSLNTTAVSYFISFIEKRFGANFLYNEDYVPYGKIDLLDLFELSTKLQESKIIYRILPDNDFPDEPPFYKWTVSSGSPKKLEMSGGMSIRSDRDALTAALAEAVERYLWLSVTDYFKSPTIATAETIKKWEYL